MAKHKTSSALAKVIPMATPRPIVVSQTKVVKAKGRHKHHGSHTGAGLMNKGRMGIVTGALALGFIDKQNLPIPELPIIGRAGTIALGAYFLSDNGRNKFMAELCTAAMAVAAYEMGNKGSIVGDPGDGTFVGGV